MKHTILICLFVFFASTLSATAEDIYFKDNGNSSAHPYGTITEGTPSVPQYFSWINNTNEGSTEGQTLINLEFFRWLHDEYGMHLGIYAWDAGNIDSASYYGSMQTERFKKQFPNGWKGIAEKAVSFDCRLGLWGGPDGFGNTPDEEKKRTELLVSLCRDYGLQLFKFDAVCGQLRDKKQDAFAHAMSECRKYAPDLIVLNHRLNLGKALPHATTFLMGGAETYIDVHMVNRNTATHNRQSALSRGLPPDLKRLTEDHGVCLSSCLDYWEDDLILQAFNRCLILAPEIYGNPWLLRDDEFSKLARIYNLHYRNREILVKGLVLPEETYGRYAVARGDGSSRFVTLRNLTWEPIVYHVRLDQEIGLTERGTVHVRRYHPSERILGEFSYGKTIEVEVAPFRSYLLMATVKSCPEVGVVGCDYEVFRDTEHKPVLLKLLGMPGERATVKLQSGKKTFSRAFLNGRPTDAILKKGVEITFPGRFLTKAWHRKLADLTSTQVPEDAEQLYEATCFSARNDALEVQSLYRSGPTRIPQVQKARDAFFNQELFWRRGIWDKYMFDGKNETFFSVYHYRSDKRIDKGVLRLDFGSPVKADRILLTALWPTDREVAPPKEMMADVSVDLKNWLPIKYQLERHSGAMPQSVKIANILRNGGEHRLYDANVCSWTSDLSNAPEFRYMRIPSAPDRVAEIVAWKNNPSRAGLNRSPWRASNLFAPYNAVVPEVAWQATVQIDNDDTLKGSYLCVALEGNHGTNKAFAALRVGDQWIGASQRAPSFPCVAWEYGPSERSRNNTYFFPVTENMGGKRIDIVVLGLRGCKTEINAHAWITAYPVPYELMELRLED